MRKRLSSGAILILLLTVLVVSMFRIGTNQIGRCAEQQAEPTIFEDDVPVIGTYLRAFEWWPYWGPGQYEWDEDLEMNVGVSTDYHLEEPLIVDLQAYGFTEGDMLVISSDGVVYFSGAWNPLDPWTESDINEYCLIGLFSSTSELKPTGELNRVPGAIDVAVGDYSTGSTFWNAELETLLITLADKSVDISNLQYGSAPTDIPQDFVIAPSMGMWIEVPKNARYLFICVIDNYYVDNIGSVTVTIDKDTDHDGVRDSWETSGIDADNDGTVDLSLEGADWEHKDIYVEVDWLPGHRPFDEAINSVKEAFDKADIYNPDLTTGIHLHVDLDEGVMPSGGINPNLTNVWDDFDLIKKAYFGSVSQRDNTNTIEAKKLAYHYCLFIHQFAEWNVTGTGSFETSRATGIGELPGNDFIVATGLLSVHGGTVDQQAAIFMHELGHNLGLRHGGQDNINCKPNYLSVMNYMYMFNEPIRSRPLDFSREKLKTLDESNLDEADGLGVDSVPSYSYWEWNKIVRPTWVGSHYSEVVDTFRRIDWDQDLVIDNSGVQANINNFPQWKASSPGLEQLESFVDWTHLDYYFVPSKNFPDGVHIYDPGMEEITADVVELMHQTALRTYDANTNYWLLPAAAVGGLAAAIIVVVFFFWRSRVRKKNPVASELFNKPAIMLNAMKEA